MLRSVPLGCLAAGLVVALAREAWPQPPAALVAVTPVVQREVAAGQTFVGTIRPLRTSAVGSPVDGRVEKFPVNEGDRVKKGQVLARLRTRTLELEVAVARGLLQMHQEELAELEQGSRPEEIEQAKARMLSAESRMRNSKSKRQRARTLIQGRAVGEEDLQEAVEAAEQAERAYQEARAAWDLMVKGPRKEKIAQARAKVQSQLAEVQRLEDILDKHTIVAPFDGYVTAEHTEVGQWLMKGALVVDVIELDQVDVEVHVPEDSAGALVLHTPARVEVGALPKEAFTGKVALVVPHAHMRSRSFPVKVRLPNRRDGDQVLLKAGMFARVTLPVGKKERALLVPKDALVLGGPAPVVYVVDPDPSDPKKGKVRPVPVELGVADGGDIQIKGPLTPGAHVVVQGNERLVPGQEVQITSIVKSEPVKTAGSK